MRRASLFFQHHKDNDVFQPGGAYFLPFRLLRENLLSHGIELNTPDVNTGQTVAAELHINVQRRPPAAPACVYLYEHELIRPRNADRAALLRYQKILGWGVPLSDLPAERQIYLPYPNRLEQPAKVPTFAERTLGCVLVAGNKAITRADPRALQDRRLDLICAFEKTAPQFFQLYGRGWEFPPASSGHFGRLCSSLRKRWLRPPATPVFPSWRGPASDKDALLRDSRFCLCYENAADIPSYITEKIFDALRNGAVPVYWGAPDIARHIPADCYVHAREFSSAEEIVAHLLHMDATTHARHQHAIANWLRSPAAQEFSEAHFVKKITDALLVIVAAATR